MSLNLQNTRQHLQDFDFHKLFINELGWNNPPFALKADDGEAKGGIRFHRAPVAVLSGIHVFEITTPGGTVPDRSGCAAIHAAVSKLAAENLLIFTDTARTQSLWYWVKREAGKSHPRDHLYVKGQPGDLFLSKLAALVVDITELDEKGNIPLTEVAKRLKNALDVERVTKKFYGEFDTERLEFTELIEGIADEQQRRWYASVLMNRLMFIYFLQKKFFLDCRNEHYLENKLAESRKRGPDQFYKVFLRSLFFEGFAKPEASRSAAARALLGNIRYLNGGLFLPHHVELNHGFPDKPRIKIPDRAFENVFNLFGRYSWNLNDTPGGKDDEINPDVLGYIFEKYINQKEFGAYYTRAEMTGYLSERTIFKLVLNRVNKALNRQFHSISDLLLNLDAKLCRALVFEILPSLRLLDPACGSGAFLVAAMKVLINIYSAILGKVELHFLGDADLKKWHAEVHGEHRAPAYYIKKRIITENLFGVDIMEEATEIARLRLFLALVASAQTEDQLEPLPNIDFNILAGNSLIGLLKVSADRFDAGLPQEGGAQDRLTLQHGSDLGFVVESKTAPTRQETESAHVAKHNAERYATILAEKEQAITLYKRRAFTDGKRQGKTRDEDLAELRDKIETLRRSSYEQLNKMLLAEFQALDIQFEQATWNDKKNDTGKPEKRRLKLSDIEALRPFHWGYEFDRVLAEGGFDGIITNPPWEIFKPNSKEFFDDYSNLVSKNKMTIKDFEKEQARLLKDPEIRAAWLEFLSRYPHVSLYFRNAPQFRNQIAIVNGKKAGTDINLYKLFLEQSLRLLRDGGQCGILTPGGIYTDLGAKQLREMLFSQTEITSLFGLTNEKFIFEGVHHAQKFCVLTFSNGRSTSAFEAAFRINPREAVEPERLEGFLHDSASHVQVPVALIRRLSPDALSVTEFRSPADIDIAEKLALFPFLSDQIDGVWNVELAREFDMGNDSHLFRGAAKAGRAPLVQGGMIHQFDHRFAAPKYWIELEDGRRNLLGQAKDEGQKLPYQNYRFVHRRISSSTNERTAIACVTPPNRFCADTAQTTRNALKASELILFAAIFNSFVADWEVRQRVTQHMDMHFVYRMRIPRLTAADATFAPIVKRAAQLICTTPEFDALAEEVRTALRLPASAVKGVTDAAGRAKLRAELDGMIAHLYGLTEAEFAHILTTFPLVAESVKSAALEAYRVGKTC